MKLYTYQNTEGNTETYARAGSKAKVTVETGDAAVTLRLYRERGLRFEKQAPSLADAVKAFSQFLGEKVQLRGGSAEFALRKKRR